MNQERPVTFSKTFLRLGPATILCIFLFSMRGFCQESDQRDDESRLHRDSQQENTRLRYAIETIAHNYLFDIKPIFRKACFDCHGGFSTQAWYYSIPFIKDIIDADIAKAREHLDLSNDYPFLANGKMTHDLQAISQSIQTDKMPPIEYVITHWSRSLNSAQKEQIQRWVSDSMILLSNAGHVAASE